MTTEIQKTATENIDVFFGKINEAADIVSAKLVAVAPEAAEALLNLVQFKGIFSLVSGCALLGTAILFGVPVLKNCIKGWNFETDNNEMWATVRTLGSIVFVVLGILGLIEVFDFYNWLSAFYPQGAIAMKALEAVGVNL